MAALCLVIWLVLLTALWISLEDSRASPFTHSLFPDEVKIPIILINMMKRQEKTAVNKDLTRADRDIQIRRVMRSMKIKTHLVSQATVKNKLNELRINLTQLQINIKNYIDRYGARNGQRLASGSHHRRVQSLDLRYYNLSRPKTDHSNFDFLIDASNICRNSIPFIIILVPSAQKNIDKRRSIRNTWGQYARQLRLPKPYESSSVKLAFLIGKDPNSTDNHVQTHESKMYRDIVFGDFHDSYNNLTRKILQGLIWVNRFCPGSKYIVKADDDAFVHIPNLVEMIKKNPADQTGCIYGKLHPRSKVQRTGKWEIPYDVYPMSEYPPYVTGGTYVISGNIAWKLVAVSGYMPYLKVEDAFITGVLRFVIGSYIEASPDFMNGEVSNPTPCNFMSGNMISANIRNVSLMTEMWTTQHQFSNVCEKLASSTR